MACTVVLSVLDNDKGRAKTRASLQVRSFITLSLSLNICHTAVVKQAPCPEASSRFSGFGFGERIGGVGGRMEHVYKAEVWYCNIDWRGVRVYSFTGFSDDFIIKCHCFQQ